MKSSLYPKTFIVLAMAVMAAAGSVSQAQDQPASPPMATGALPAGVVPGSPLADVIKMLQAGVDIPTIKSYVITSTSPFNLDADQILFLKDEGAPSDLINAMMARDKALSAASVPPPPAPAAPVAPVAPMAPMAPAAPVDTSVPDMTPPQTDVNVNYFYDSLTPYGSWVDVDGYGRCWRPTVVMYDSGWNPYCDRGHWVYTDCGWYWDSDYAWGVTFHYGRWFRNPRFGWCWYPDTVWAPSWVTWRSDTDYCGWAPLPPFAVFMPGVGFYYRGVAVGLDFDFGLSADCFVFVAPGNFCDRHPRSFCLPPQRVAAVFHHTTVINSFSVNSKTMVNRGIGVDRIATATHRPIEPIHVGALPNAGRQGWRGDVGLRPTPASYNSGNSQLRRGPETLNNPVVSAHPTQIESYHSPVQNSPSAVAHPTQFQSAAPGQARQPSTFTEPNRVTPAYSSQPNNQWSQGRSTTVPANVGGAAQLPQRQYVAPDQPSRVAPAPNMAQPEVHNNTPAPEPTQPQRVTASGNANNGSSNTKTNPNKQNQ
jgi:hypothetical protein